MHEFTAAFGVVQTERLESIVAWKNDYARTVLDPQYPHRLKLPAGMRSGLYKYIVFNPIPRSTGRVYSHPCHRILRHDVSLPNTDWVAANHWCVPIFFPRYLKPASSEDRSPSLALRPYTGWPTSPGSPPVV